LTGGRAGRTTRQRREQRAELRRPGHHRLGDAVVGGQRESQRENQLADPHRPVLL